MCFLCGRNLIFKYYLGKLQSSSIIPFKDIKVVTWGTWVCIMTIKKSGVLWRSHEAYFPTAETLKMEAAFSFEILVLLYEITNHHTPHDHITSWLISRCHMRTLIHIKNTFKEDSVKAGRRRMLYRSCSQANTSSARLIFLWTVSIVTLGYKCSAISVSSCVQCYTSEISFYSWQNWRHVTSS